MIVRIYESEWAYLRRINLRRCGRWSMSSIPGSSEGEFGRTDEDGDYFVAVPSGYRRRPGGTDVPLHSADQKVSPFYPARVFVEIPLERVALSKAELRRVATTLAPALARCETVILHAGSAGVEPVFRPVLRSGAYVEHRVCMRRDVRAIPVPEGWERWEEGEALVYCDK